MIIKVMEIIKYHLESPNTVIRADYQLGHDLTDEHQTIEFIKAENDCSYLINCFKFGLEKFGPFITLPYSL